MAFEAHEDSDEVMSEINMTPLVDVMLVLLIIFIITMPVIQHTVKVALPRASSSRDQTPPDKLQLSVDAQGRFFLDEQAVAADALQERLREQAARLAETVQVFRVEAASSDDIALVAGLRMEPVGQVSPALATKPAIAHRSVAPPSATAPAPAPVSRERAAPAPSAEGEWETF